MIQINLFMKWRWTHRLGRQAYSYQKERCRRGINWEVGINIYMLL